MPRRHRGQYYHCVSRTKKPARATTEQPAAEVDQPCSIATTQPTEIDRYHVALHEVPLYFKYTFLVLRGFQPLYLAKMNTRVAQRGNIIRIDDLGEA